MFHKKLDVWKEMLDLVELVYRLTKKYPKEESYVLVSQMRRAVVSAPSNLAEGCARSGGQEKTHFFLISRGSLSELDTQVEISLRLQYLSKDEFEVLSEKILKTSKMMQGLINSRTVNKEQ